MYVVRFVVMEVRPFEEALADLYDAIDAISDRSERVERLVRDSSIARETALLAADAARARVAAKRLDHFLTSVVPPSIRLVHTVD